MNCPVCKVELRMMDRQGIEIDYCPQCRGVWLDRGELDKLIERTSAEAAPAAPAAPVAPVRTVTETYPAPRRDDRYDDRQSHDRSDYSGGHDGHKRKKKESFLGDMFDFGD